MTIFQKKKKKDFSEDLTRSLKLPFTIFREVPTFNKQTLRDTVGIQLLSILGIK